MSKNEFLLKIRSLKLAFSIFIFGHSLESLKNDDKPDSSLNSINIIKTPILDNWTPILIVYNEYPQFKGEIVRSNFWKFLEEYTSTCHEKPLFLITSTYTITSKRIIQVKIFSS
jgi:hypothetical protein